MRISAARVVDAARMAATIAPNLRAARGERLYIACILHARLRNPDSRSPRTNSSARVLVAGIVLALQPIASGLVDGLGDAAGCLDRGGIVVWERPGRRSVPEPGSPPGSTQAAGGTGDRS